MADTRDRTGPILELVGGALVVAGALLPWASVSTVFGTASVPGTEGDGLIALAVGGVLCLLAILELGNRQDTRTLALYVAMAAGGLGVYEWITVRDKLLNVSSELARASVGIGIYAVIAGAALAFVAALALDR